MLGWEIRVTEQTVVELKKVELVWRTRDLNLLRLLIRFNIKDEKIIPTLPPPLCGISMSC